MILIEENSLSLDRMPVEQIKVHLRLGSGFSDDSLQDTLLAGFLRAAFAAVEARTGKILLSRRFSWRISQWSTRDRLALPVAPIADLVEVAILDRDGEATPLSGEAYGLLQHHGQPAMVAITTLPTIPTAGMAQITFDAGFGENFDDLPADLGQAVMMLAAHYYENRDATALGEATMPYGVSVLLERYRTIRLVGGA